MKNKEIEEILNDLKNTADTSFFALCGSEEELKKMPRGVCNFLTLNDKKAKLLLSYIEQLENNRDKVIKVCDFYNKKYQKDLLGNKKVLFVISNIMDVLGDKSD